MLVYEPVVSLMVKPESKVPSSAPLLSTPEVVVQPK